MASVDVVIPSYRGMLPESQSTLVQMMNATQCTCGGHPPWKCPKGKHSVWRPPQVRGSSVVHWSRNQALALDLYGVAPFPDGRPQAEYVFLMDDDMLCQPGYLSRLLSYKADIVSGIATIKRDPLRCNIRFWRPDMETFVDPVEWDWESNKLMEVDGAGAAFMLVKRRVFEKMGEAHLSCFFEREEDKRKFPNDARSISCDVDNYWDKKEKRRREVFAAATDKGGDWKRADCWWFQFLDNIVDSQTGELGEDLAFCWKAKKLGFKVYADPQVLPGHIGEYGYSILDYRQQVEDAKKAGLIAEMPENKVGIAV